MKIVIFGANGPTGRLMTREVLDHGYSAIAVTRRPDGFPISDPRLTVAKADVYDAAALTDVVGGGDVVLSVLGVPFALRRVDTFSKGTANIVSAMLHSGIRRLVAVSSTGAFHYRNRENPSLSLRLFAPIISNTIGKTVYDDMRRMENVVRGGGLDWTIVRPSTLFDLPQRTRYVAGDVAPVGAFTARIDLAHYVTTLATDDTSVGKTVIVSTIDHAPTFWQNMKREAFNPTSS